MVVVGLIFIAGQFWFLSERVAVDVMVGVGVGWILNFKRKAKAATRKLKTATKEHEAAKSRRWLSRYGILLF
jgi:membrane protein YqaA with SNARE-associated domain